MKQMGFRTRQDLETAPRVIVSGRKIMRRAWSVCRTVGGVFLIVCILQAFSARF